MLTKLDATSTGTTIQLVVEKQGKVRSIDVTTKILTKFENRRTRNNDEFLRMMVIRALAPLDLEMPSDGIELDRGFTGNSLWAISTPITAGAWGRVRLDHQAQMQDETHVKVSSKGDGTIIPGGDIESAFKLKAHLEGEAVFDLDKGRVAEALWLTVGIPTAAAGPLAQQYSTVTLMRAIGDDGKPVLRGPFADAAAN